MLEEKVKLEDTKLIPCVCDFIFKGVMLDPESKDYLIKHIHMVTNIPINIIKNNIVIENIDINLVSKVTGLSIEQIEKIEATRNSYF